MLVGILVGIIFSQQINRTETLYRENLIFAQKDQYPSNKGLKELCSRELRKMSNSDFNKTLCTYRVRKKMNLENINYGGKTV